MNCTDPSSKMSPVKYFTFGWSHRRKQRRRTSTGSRNKTRRGKEKDLMFRESVIIIAGGGAMCGKITYMKSVKNDATQVENIGMYNKNYVLNAVSFCSRVRKYKANSNGSSGPGMFFGPSSCFSHRSSQATIHVRSRTCRHLRCG